MIYLDILKISEWVYKKLETVITFGWKDLDFLIYFLHLFFLSEHVFLLQAEKQEERACLKKRMRGCKSDKSECSCISSILEGAKGSAWKPRTNQWPPTLASGHTAVAPSPPPSAPTLFPPLLPPSPPPASRQCGTVQLSWAQLEFAIDPRRGAARSKVGFPFTFSQEAELESGTSSAQMNSGRWLCPAACSTQIGNSCGENLRSTFLAADWCESWLWLILLKLNFGSEVGSYCWGHLPHGQG